MNNYHYIIAGLPVLLLNGENKEFSYGKFRDEIYRELSASDRRLVEWLEFGFDENNLNSHFYTAALSHSNSYIRNYYTMDLQIRNSKVDYIRKEHGGKLNESLKSSYTLCDAICPEQDAEDAEKLSKIFRTSDILDKEQMLDRFKWEKINDFITFHYFDIEVILSFLSKAMMIERWEKLDKERGKELFKKMVLEVKGTFKGVS